jgi:hypothetical protein
MISNIEKYTYKSKPQFNKHLLFHHTYISALKEIINHDVLRVNRTCDKVTSISFTRCSYYSDAYVERIVLDYNLLKIDGYNTTPYDEVTMNLRNHLDNDSFKIKTKGYSKVNPNTFGRCINNKLNTKITHIGKTDPLEWEYEERIFKNIKNLGKYIISIETNIHHLKHLILPLKNYIDKYPHIEIILLDDEKPYDRRTKIKFNELYRDYYRYRESVEKMVCSDVFDKECNDLFSMVKV